MVSTWHVLTTAVTTAGPQGPQCVKQDLRECNPISALTLHLTAEVATKRLLCESLDEGMKQAPVTVHRTTQKSRTLETHHC